MARLYVHPLPVRIWHWINAVGFIVLIVTGLQLRFVGQIDLMSFRNAVRVHNWVGFVLMANFFIWLLYYLFSDRITVYHQETSPRRYFDAAFKQMRYYGWGIFRGEPNPHRITTHHKFNAMQSMLYQVVMLIIVPVQFISGLLLWDVMRFAKVVELAGGVRVVDTVHVLCFIFFCFFIVAHVYLCSLGHTASAHFKAMFDGYEDVQDPPAVR